MPLSDSVLREIEDLVGSDHLLVDHDLTARFRTDWTGRFRSGPVPVVRPDSTEQVQFILRLANAESFHVVPQGGNTGLVGGCVPTALDSVIVSTERLGYLGEVDRLGARITVGAGVRLGLLQAALRDTGWSFGVDLGARASCTIGGMVATNAGGINVVRYGMMRHQVVGIEAVLGDGTIVSHLSGLEKDNTGFDLEGLLTGSEGTLAVITRVVLRLRPNRPQVATVLLGFDQVDAAVAAASELRRNLPSLESIELMLKSGIELVRSAFGGGIPPVGQAEAVLLVEVAGDHGVDDELAAACAGIAAFLCVEPAVAIGSSARAGLWRWREEHTAAIATLGVPLKMDVSLPHRNISAFLAALGELDLPSVPIVFGHLGDGNLHVNVPNCMAEEGSGHRVAPNVEEIERTILQLVVSFGGSISAEHGIGVAKAHYLSMTRSPSEIATFRAIKRAFDPGNVLNPGVLLPVTIDKVSPPPVSSHDAQEVSPHREPT